MIGAAIIARLFGTPAERAASGEAERVRQEQLDRETVERCRAQLRAAHRRLGRSMGEEAARDILAGALDAAPAAEPEPLWDLAEHPLASVDEARRAIARVREVYGVELTGDRFVTIVRQILGALPQVGGDHERVEALEGALRLLVEVVGDVIAASRSQMHEESFENRDNALGLALDGIEGKLDAVLSGLGARASQRGRGGRERARP